MTVLLSRRGIPLFTELFSAPESKEKRARIFIAPRWGGPAGMRNIMIIAIPLIMSNAVHSVNLFMDRTFLAWYSQETFAASLQAGMLYWTIITLALQTVFYASTFVAHYYGAGRLQKIGAVVWQAIYLSILGGIVMACLAPIGFPIFRLIDHVGNLPLLEGQYFRILMLGSIGMLFNGALYSFFAGQGRTMFVLFVNAATCLLNVCLNIWMIFTPIWIFPEGIEGAAWATVISTCIGSLIFLLFILVHPESETKFGFFSGMRFNWDLLKRFLRFGFPSGVHGMIDMIGFTTFMMVVGRFGLQAQLASNMALNINLLLFIPAIGMHVTTSILAGQFGGMKNHEATERMTSGANLICMVYMALVCLIYIFLPEPLINMFRGGTSEAEWLPVLSLAKLLLIYVAAYSTADAMLLVYSGTLKGSGDTKFVMWVSVILSQLLLVLPCLVLGIWYRDVLSGGRLGVMLAWALFANYLLVLGLVNLLRYRSGHWKDFDVIEQLPVGLSDPEVELPGADAIAPAEETAPR